MQASDVPGTPERAARLAAFVAATPHARLCTPNEVAAAALWLASDETGHVTGAEIHVDGGILAGATAAPRNGG